MIGKNQFWSGGEREREREREKKRETVKKLSIEQKPNHIRSFMETSDSSSVVENPSKQVR